MFTFFVQVVTGCLDLIGSIKLFCHLEQSEKLNKELEAKLPSILKFEDKSSWHQHMLHIMCQDTAYELQLTKVKLDTWLSTICKAKYFEKEECYMITWANPAQRNQCFSACLRYLRHAIESDTHLCVLHQHMRLSKALFGEILKGHNTEDRREAYAILQKIQEHTCPLCGPEWIQELFHTSELQRAQYETG